MLANEIQKLLNDRVKLKNEFQCKKTCFKNFNVNEVVNKHIKFIKITFKMKFFDLT